jgi:hypothetical protein
MKVEKPCSPDHCLGMLNDNMRTDILRAVHEGMRARMDAQDAKLLGNRHGEAQRKSPLEMFIESIENVLARFEGRDLFAALGPNPFNANPRYRFQSESDYRHDIALLRSQLGALREILAEIEW